MLQLWKKTKALISQHCDDCLQEDTNLERWINRTITASERRVLLTKCLADASEEVCNTTGFEKVGHRTWCLMTADGSEDQEICSQCHALHDEMFLTLNPPTP